MARRRTVPPCLLVYTTFGTRRDALRIGRELVARRLAACANIHPIRSFYRWQGRVCAEGEYAVWLKTRAARYPALARVLRERHPYELPCIVALRIDRGLREYLRWVSESSRIASRRPLGVSRRGALGVRREERNVSR